MKFGPIVVLSSVIAIFGTSLSGCYRVSQYSGDGQLADNGAGAATDRYVLNLGPIDLTQRGTKTFRIANLPETNFVVGIEVNGTPEERAVLEKQPASPVVAIELSGSDGKILFAKKAPLSSWTWSVPAGNHRSFVYGREEPGTYFTPAPKTEYKLTLNVLEPDPSQPKYKATLLAKSGGWK